MLQQSIKHHSLCLQSLPTIAPFLLPAQQAAGLFYLVRAQHEVGCWAYWLPAWCSLVPVNGCWHRLAFAVLQVVASCLKWVSHLLTQQLFWNSTEVMKSMGMLQKRNFHRVFPGACSDTSMPCVLLSPCFHTNLVMPWLSVQYRNCCTYWWGSYFHVGVTSEKSVNTKGAAACSQSTQKRHDIICGPHTHTLDISLSAEHVDPNSLSPTVYSSAQMLRVPLLSQPM